MNTREQLKPTDPGRDERNHYIIVSGILELLENGSPGEMMDMVDYLQAVQHDMATSSRRRKLASELVKIIKAQLK